MGSTAVLRMARWFHRHDFGNQGGVARQSFDGSSGDRSIRTTNQSPAATIAAAYETAEKYAISVDPWAALARLSPLVKSGGVALASSPNVSHYSIVANLARGRFELTDFGAMDRTHMRWFTPATYRALFEGAGFAVEETVPVTAFAPRTRRPSSPRRPSIRPSSTRRRVRVPPCWRS